MKESISIETPTIMVAVEISRTRPDKTAWGQARPSDIKCTVELGMGTEPP